MDLATAANVRDLEGKFDHGTAASLSRIEDQNAMLHRIETSSHTGMHSSAASVRSLQSIATSLSRIEARVSGSEFSLKSHQRRNSDEKGSGRHLKRSSSDEFEYRGRHSPIGSAVRRKSSYASLRNAAGSMGPPAIEEEPLHPGVFSSPLSFEAGQARLQKSINDFEGLVEPALKHRLDPGQTFHPNLNDCVYGRAPDSKYWEIPGQEQIIECINHTTPKDIVSIVSVLLPAAVAKYVRLTQRAKDLQSKLDALHLLHHELRKPLPTQGESDEQSLLRASVQENLSHVRFRLARARIRCDLEGYPLYDIDQRLRPPVNQESHDNFWEKHNMPGPSQAGNRYLVEMCNSKSSVYGEWFDRGSQSHQLLDAPLLMLRRRSDANSIITTSAAA